MVVPLSLLACALAVSAAGIILWQKRQVRLFQRGLAERLARRFPSVAGDVPTDAFALCSPPGRIAVQEDGLLVRLDLGETNGLRHVPWAEIRNFDTTGADVVRVHVLGVGDLAVPLAAGRKIWDGTLRISPRRRGAFRQPVRA